MDDSLRQMIRRARRSGRSTDDAGRTSTSNPLEQRAAEAVRLARVAAAVHMSEVMIDEQSQHQSDSRSAGAHRQRQQQHVATGPGNGAALQWAGDQP